MTTDDARESDLHVSNGGLNRRGSFLFVRERVIRGHEDTRGHLGTSEAASEEKQPRKNRSTSEEENVLSVFYSSLPRGYFWINGDKWG